MYRKIIPSVALVVVPTAAYAQEVAEAASSVDLTEPATGIIGVIGVLIGVGLKWAWGLIAGKLGIESPETDEKVHALVDKYLDEAVDYGVGKLESADWLKIETKNAAVAHAVNYALKQSPTLLEKVGLTEEQLKMRLEAKLLKHDTAPGEWTE